MCFRTGSEINREDYLNVSPESPTDLLEFCLSFSFSYLVVCLLYLASGSGIHK